MCQPHLYATLNSLIPWIFSTYMRKEGGPGIQSQVTNVGIMRGSQQLSISNYFSLTDTVL